MRCDTGCGECCGVVPTTKAEFSRIRAYIGQKGIVPLDQGVTCPFYQEGSCKVYKVRPIICQLYGHMKEPRMTCPRGYNTNIPLHVGERILAQNGEPTHLLHEFLPGFDQEKLKEDMRKYLESNLVAETNEPGV
jgi:Fe-S-cluster containining protein